MDLVTNLTYNSLYIKAVEKDSEPDGETWPEGLALPPSECARRVGMDPTGTGTRFVPY